ncbi:MAG TPA: tRNA pseudouridine(55) synthase TruB [Gemmatimonadaceae bacterium]|nr:tRNA pseudouridine(55) synthase TruB [Gemmatimonadaceae bacterium]
MPPPAKIARRRAEGRAIDGMLLVDKPAGITSHDVVSIARRALGTRRIGHGGTLDPFATGLLVLLVGYATRLLPHMDGEPKVYDATIAFGTETDTDDVTGTVTRTAALPEPALVRSAIGRLTGAIEQVPPAFSAKQVDGRRAYDAARQGEALELQPVRVTVHEWVVRELTADHAHVTISCGGGTYIRALARDVGRLTGSAAHLAALRRTRSGRFAVSAAVSMDDLREGRASVQPPVDAIRQLPAVTLVSDAVANVRHGRTVPVIPDVGAGSAGKAALVDEEGGLVAVAERVGEVWQPRVVLPDA